MEVVNDEEHVPWGQWQKLLKRLGETGAALCQLQKSSEELGRQLFCVAVHSVHSLWVACWWTCVLRERRTMSHSGSSYFINKTTAELPL